MDAQPVHVTLPLHIARDLFRVYETWWHQVGTYDPGHELISDGTKLTGIGGLLSSADAVAMDEACEQVERHEPPLREWLGLPALGPVSPGAQAAVPE